MFEFKITLDDNDYLLFNQYFLLNSKIGKKTLMYYRLCVPFLSFIFIVLLYIVGTDSKLILTETIVLTILSIFMISYSKKIILRSVKNRMKNMKKEGRLPYGYEATIKFDDENIYEITPNTESKTKYSFVEKVAVTEKAIYIYINSIQAYILPVNVFTDEMEKSKFLEFINLKIGLLNDCA